MLNVREAPATIVAGERVCHVIHELNPRASPSAAKQNLAQRSQSGQRFPPTAVNPHLLSPDLIISLQPETRLSRPLRPVGVRLAFSLTHLFSSRGHFWTPVSLASHYPSVVYEWRRGDEKKDEARAFFERPLDSDFLCVFIPDFAFENWQVFVSCCAQTS